MALGRYLGGIGIFTLGIFILFSGMIAAALEPSSSSAVCSVTGIIGILLILVGGFYARTAHRLVPQKIDVISNKKADRYCPSCGRAIPFDANVCPYCGKFF